MCNQTILKGAKKTSSTYRVFEPRDAHHPNHDSSNDSPQPHESKLCAGVAFVIGAVGSIPGLSVGSRAGDAVQLYLSVKTNTLFTKISN